MKTDSQSQKHTGKPILPPASGQRATYSLLYNTENTTKGINYSQPIPALAAYVVLSSSSFSPCILASILLYGLHDARFTAFFVIATTLGEWIG